MPQAIAGDTADSLVISGAYHRTGMKYVLTLIGKGLTAERLDIAAGLVGAEAAPEWLGSDEAAETGFEAQAAEVAETAVRQTFAGDPIDVVVQPATSRRRKLLVADMDSTIISVECIDELADTLGLRAEVAGITAAAMAGEIKFQEALQLRVAMLKGMSQDVLQRVYDERVSLTSGARTLVMTMRANGAYTALVSGGFTFFTERVAKAAGFDLQIANRLEIAHGRLLGSVSEPIVDSDTKRQTLMRLKKKFGLQHSETMAVGDGANDLPMIEAAGIGVAFRAKPVLVEAAQAQIAYNDLTALLYLQGYRREEFVQ